MLRTPLSFFPEAKSADVFSQRQEMGHGSDGPWERPGRCIYHGNDQLLQGGRRLRERVVTSHRGEQFSRRKRQLGLG